MTTEFNQSSFAVVAKFFSDDDTSQPASPLEEVLPPSAGRGRNGVGATVTRKQQLSEPMKKILQVGRKRQRENDGDDEEVAIIPGGEIDEEEEEEGRTAISEKIKRPSKIASAVSHTDGSSKKKKKKLGKKERHAQRHDSDHTEAAASCLVGNSPSQCDDEISEAIKEVALKKKKRRKKIRSKQKNICKDKRANQEKPVHLRVGNGRLYEGRPMTETTRAKLKLPPSRTTRYHGAVQQEPQRELEVEQMTLAIDELDAVDVGEPGPGDFGTNAGVSLKPPTEERSRKKRTMKKKKRSKYRNL